MEKIRVVLVGLGPIGIITLKEALRREAIEVLGGIDIDPALVGKDLGVLAGGAPCGKMVRADMEAALADWKPGAALLTTVSQVDRVAPQVEALVRAGANVVSSSEELLLASHRAPGIAARLDKIAKEAGVTVVGAGVNPGFAMDLFPLVMSYMSRGVERVQVWRRLDASLRRGPLQRKAGAGLTVEEFRAGEAEGWVGHKGLQESVVLLCQGLGWEPDRVVETLDPIIAEDPIRTGDFDVKPGQVGGIHHTGRAWKGERLLVEMDLKMFMGAEDTFDRVRIEGMPPLDVTVRGGILGDDATAAALMNTVPLAVQAPAGLLSPPRAAASPGRGRVGRLYFIHEKGASRSGAPGARAPEKGRSMTLPVEPVLTVLIFSALAAAFSAAGVLPFSFREEPPLRWIGWAYSLASGLMLGAGYLLMVEGLVGRGWAVILGGGLGVAYTWWSHRYSGTGEMETRPGGRAGTEAGYKVILLYAMHSASEGVAIGVAMAVNLRLGIFMAIALAVHNAAEGTALTEVLRGRGMRLGEAAGLSVVARVPQTLLALVSFSVIPAVPWLLPWALGFAAGALLYLVMTELLPASYERAGHTGIALVVSFSAGVVVLLKTFFV